MNQWNRFRPYYKGDLVKVWRSLRPEDLREYEAVRLTDPELIEAYILSSNPRLSVWECEEGPVAILGVSPLVEVGVGGVWAIASTLAESRWRFAVRHTSECLATLSEGYRLLSNYKDTRNTQQIKWLHRLGFTFFRTEENFMGSGAPFHQFVRIVK